MPGERQYGSRALTLAGVARDARMGRDFLLLCILSVGLATIGLLQSSTAVVIGAMLISPLMKPIMGIGFAIATFDNVLLRRALTTLALGVGVSIAVALFLILLSPVKDVTPEILGRTQPSLLDLGVAVFGGCAGGYAVIKKQFGTMVGVGIATALMPPLATVAFGLATARPDFASGAALLFLTNVMAIAFSATAFARVYGFGPSLSQRQTAIQTAGIMSALALISVPLALSLQEILADTRMRARARAVVAEVMGPRAEIAQMQVSREDGRINLTATVIAPDYDAGRQGRIAALLKERLEHPVDVRLMQVREQSGQLEALEARLAQRLTTLERGTEARALQDALRDAGFSADRISIDPNGRVATVSMLPDDPESSGPLDALDRQFPAWQIVRDQPDERSVPSNSAKPGSDAP